jgi:flagellum-specific peptidoglycan hydrolase FlgJ
VTALTEKQRSAMTAILPAAIASERATGCPAELTVAQWAIESAWGSAVFDNNPFGIKAYPGCAGSQLLRTQEWFTDLEVRGFLARGQGRTAEIHGPRGGSRNLYDVRDFFATFPSLAAAFAYHGRLLQQGPYLAAWQRYQKDHDLAVYIHGIAVHYSTTASYGDTVAQWATHPEITAAVVAAR